MNQNRNEIYYFSDKNVDVLLELINSYFIKNYSFQITNTEEELLFEVMKIKFENRRPELPNENFYNYVKELNANTLNTVIKIIKKKLDQEIDKKINNQQQKKNIDFSIKLDNNNEEISKKFKEIIDQRNSFNQIQNDNNQTLLPLKSEKELVNIPEKSQKELKIKPNPNQDIIQEYPDEKFQEIEEHTFIIDSRERNNYSSTNPNSYTIQFDKPFKNIVELELLSTEIPTTQYVVNSYNNQLNVGGTNITISTGNYSSSELALELQTNIRNDTADSNYSVSVDTNKMKFTVSHSSTPFVLDLSLDNSIAKVIGFSPNSFSSALSHTSDKTFDLFGEKYIVMHVNNFYSNVVSNQEKLEGAFAKIPLTVPLFSVEYFIYDKLRAFKKFTPPLSVLDYLKIEFRTYDGNLYDFNGQEHSLTFIVRTKTCRRNMQQVDI